MVSYLCWKTTDQGESIYFSQYWDPWDLVDCYSTSTCLVRSSPGAMPKYLVSYFTWLGLWGVCFVEVQALWWWAQVWVIVFHSLLGGGLEYPIPGEMIQFDEHIFQMGWFNHQLVYIVTSPTEEGRKKWLALQHFRNQNISSPEAGSWENKSLLVRPWNSKRYFKFCLFLCQKYTFMYISYCEMPNFRYPWI